MKNKVFLTSLVIYSTLLSSQHIFTMEQISANLDLQSTKKSGIKPSQELITKLKTLKKSDLDNPSTKEQYLDFIKQCKKDGVTIESCIKEIINQKYQSALSALEQEWKLNQPNCNLQSIQEHVAQQKKVDRLKDAQNRIVIFDESLRLSPEIIEFIEDCFINQKIYPNLSVQPYKGALTSYEAYANRAFARYKDYTCKFKQANLKLNEYFSELDLQVQKAIILHEFIHLKKYHATKSHYYYLAACLSKVNQLINYGLPLFFFEKTNDLGSSVYTGRLLKGNQYMPAISEKDFYSSESYNKINRAEEFEADLKAAITDIDIAKGLINNIKGNMRVSPFYDSKPKSIRSHPKNRTRLAWAQTIYQLFLTQNELAPAS